MIKSSTWNRPKSIQTFNDITYTLTYPSITVDIAQYPKNWEEREALKGSLDKESFDTFKDLIDTI